MLIWASASDAQAYINTRFRACRPANSDTLFTSALVYEIIGHRDRHCRRCNEAVKAGYSLDEIEKEPELRKTARRSPLPALAAQN